MAVGKSADYAEGVEGIGMGGRPQVMGLIAVAVALWFASPVAAPPAVAEFRVPIPGLFVKEKPVRPKRHARPTLPRRNPTRVTAGVSASAVSPPQAKNSEVAAVAGAQSSASISLALPRAPERPDKTAEASAEPRSSSNTDQAETGQPDTSAEVSETQDKTAVGPEDSKAADADPNEVAKPQSATEAAENTLEGVEDEAPAEESVAGAAEKAAEEAKEDIAAEAAAGADATANVTDNAPKETAAAESSPDNSEEGETSSAESDTTTAGADPKATEAEPSESANGKPADTEADVAADQSDEAPAPAETAHADLSDSRAADGPTTDAALPNHDASVVLDVAPPPQDLTAAKDEAVEDGAAETDTATLAPPAPPIKDEKPGSEDSSPTAPVASEAGGEAGSDSSAEETQVTSGADASEEAAEVEVEPAPPPAHPVVAQVREKLEDPGLRNTVAASDLKALKAFYGAHEGPPLWVTDDGFTAKAQELIVEIGKADEWGLKASSFDVPSADDRPATPDAMAENELKLSVVLLGYARDAQIGRLTPRSVSKLFDQHPSLRDPQIVLKEIAAADKPSAYLLTLHPQHEQFKRLHKALTRARENAELTGRDPRTDRDVQLITMNMERWRWLPRSLGNYHVWNNVPEFNVRVVKGGQTIYQEKTIVGQYKYATPFFSAKMRNIVFHPNWTVPPTIVKEDIAPKLQGRGGGGFFNNSKEAILRRYGLKASFKGEPINADTVDWKNVNVQTYTFTQDPGPANVLGKFKFNFPNKHAIYMHDTVQRELFAQTTRTLSHGCIRVNQPDRFATLLLSQDKGWTASQVENLVAQNESKAIPLNRPVPVHLTYFTAVVDEYGTLNRFGDIYGIDNIMAPKLFRSPASFGAPASASFVELDPETRAGPRRRSGGGLDNFISGLFGN